MLHLLQRSALTALLLALPGAALGQTAEPRTAAAVVRADPWLVVYGGDQSRIARENLELVDRALTSYGTTYVKLGPTDRARVRQAFGDLLPGQRFTRHRMNQFQAQAIAYLALGHGGPAGRDCGRRTTLDRDTRCTMVVDSMSRDASWIRRTILALGRTGARRPRQEELATLRDMVERSRSMVVGAPRCGCAGARHEADTLFDATQRALDVHEASSRPVWSSLGSARVQRIARLSETLERTLLRCLGDGR